MAGLAAAGDAHMTERSRLPCKGCMARAAFGRRCDMRRRLAGRRNAVVATAAHTAHVRVIHAHDGNPRGACMTGIAVVVACHMCSAFSTGSGPVMAGCAGTDDLGVIDAGGRFPNGGGMTELAAVTRCYMRCVLACRGRAVVTTDAVGRNARVRESGRGSPRYRRVAGNTVGGSGNVGRRFACRRRSVVARSTVAGESGMIGFCRFPRIGAMTAAAIRCGDNMSWVLAGCSCSVVTRQARAINLRVINTRGRTPKRRSVAGFATIGGCNVGRVFAGSSRSVVAARAVGGDSGMGECGRFPGHRRVAGIAFARGGNVIDVLSGRERAVVT